MSLLAQLDHFKEFLKKSSSSTKFQITPDK